MHTWDTLATDESIEKTVNALKSHNIEALVADTKEQAKNLVLERIPEGAQVMTMTSVTLESIGLVTEINDSGRYDSVRNKLMSMNRETQSAQMQSLGAAPEWAIGSVHAVTEEGEVLIASNTGSQLPAYAYGSSHVIWVVGTQKIVANKEEGIKRLYEHSLKLESVRVQKAYGMPHSAINKILQISGEGKPGRVTLIFVKEVLGY